MTVSERPSALSKFDVPPFAERCYKAASSVWAESFNHPFLRALFDGSLSTDQFRYYQMQDARYLEAYADACSLISTRLSDPIQKLWFIEGAKLALVVERELHEGYGKKFGYDSADIAALELSPTNRGYQNHILNCAQSGNTVAAVAAITPCAWLYADIGRYVDDVVDTLAMDHPFRDWLFTYADPTFVSYTNELLAHLQFLADHMPGAVLQEEAEEAFMISTRYELMFWQQAWAMEGWESQDDIEDVKGIEEVL